MKYSVILLLIFASFNAQAQTIDSSYGTYGYAANEFMAHAYCMAQQNDGKTLLGEANQYSTGYFDVYRFTASGFADTLFGIGGYARVIFGVFSYSNPKVYDIIVQTDGKILAVGGGIYCTGGLCGLHNLIMARFLGNGTIDSSFGINGILQVTDIVPLSVGISIQNSDLTKVKLLPDGKIIIAGMVKHVASVSVTYPFIARLNTNGSLDTTYGTAGFSWLTNLNYSAPTDIHLDSAGNILVMGIQVVGTFTNLYTNITKLNNAGVQDATFGTGGIDTFNVNIYGYPVAMRVRNDGKIVVAGSVPDGDTLGYYMGKIAILETDGTLSTDIIGGIATVTIPGYDITSLNNIAVTTDNKILITGATMYFPYISNYNGVAFMGRLNTDGSFDTTFFGSGYKIFQYGPDSGYLVSNTFFNAVNILPGGKILFAGGLTQKPATGLIENGMYLVRLKTTGSTTAIINNENTSATSKIYPNPTNDILTIEAAPAIYHSFTITNTIGAVAIQQNIIAATTNISTTTFATGVYYISIHGATQNEVFMFVKR